MNNTPVNTVKESIVDDTLCAVCLSEKNALKALVDELSRTLYEVAPQSTITFNAKDLALSNLLIN